MHSACLLMCCDCLLLTTSRWQITSILSMCWQWVVEATAQKTQWRTAKRCVAEKPMTPASSLNVPHVYTWPFAVSAAECESPAESPVRVLAVLGMSTGNGTSESCMETVPGAFDQGSPPAGRPRAASSLTPHEYSLLAADKHRVCMPPAVTSMACTCLGFSHTAQSHKELD